MEKLNQILQLPERCLVSKKITKTFFKRNFDLTLSEKKLLEDSSAIIKIDWLSSLKPNQVNIEGYTDSQIIFEEIQVISVLTNENDFEKNKQKIIDLVQKFIPYHILLCVYNANEFVLNTCNKRISLNDYNKRTIEKSFITETISIIEPTDKQQAFLTSLAFENLDKHNLKSLYDSYSQCITALQTAKLTGEFIRRPIEQSKQDVGILDRINKLESEILLLQNQANKETQLNTQVKINAEVQFRRKEIEGLKHKLIN
ncbi:MAG: DUF4391 domain-containing protein [Bacteroidota bacterium]